jgi:hypothetical protein
MLSSLSGKAAFISGSENFPRLIPDNAISFLPHDMVHGEDFGVLHFDTMFSVGAIALSLPSFWLSRVDVPMMLFQLSSNIQPFCSVWTLPHSQGIL